MEDFIYNGRFKQYNLVDIEFKGTYRIFKMNEKIYFLKCFVGNEMKFKCTMKMPLIFRTIL